MRRRIHRFQGQGRRAVKRRVTDKGTVSGTVLGTARHWRARRACTGHDALHSQVPGPANVAISSARARTGSSTSSKTTTRRSESPAEPTSADHHRARSPTTGAVPNPSSPRPPRSSRTPRRRWPRPLPPRCLGSPAMGGQCEKSSCARSEINRKIRYGITCDTTAGRSRAAGLDRRRGPPPVAGRARRRSVPDPRASGPLRPRRHHRTSPGAPADCRTPVR